MSPEDDEEYDPGQWPQPGGQVAAEQYAEPEEFDPSDLGPDVPEAPDPTEGDVDIDPATHRLFWGLVVVFNAALLAVSLGLMFAGFEGRYALGGQLVLAGLVLGGYGYYRYRQFRGSDDRNG